MPRIVQGILICTDSPYPIRAKEAAAQTGAPFGASVSAAATSFLLKKFDDLFFCHFPKSSRIHAYVSGLSLAKISALVHRTVSTFALNLVAKKRSFLVPLHLLPNFVAFPKIPKGAGGMPL